MPRVWACIHEHRHGISQYVFAESASMDAESFIKWLGDEYESDIGESVECELVEVQK